MISFDLLHSKTGLPESAKWSAKHDPKFPDPRTSIFCRVSSARGGSHDMDADDSDMVQVNEVLGDHIHSIKQSLNQCITIYK